MPKILLALESMELEEVSEEVLEPEQMCKFLCIFYDFRTVFLNQKIT